MLQMQCIATLGRTTLRQSLSALMTMPVAHAKFEVGQCHGLMLWTVQAVYIIFKLKLSLFTNTKHQIYSAKPQQHKI